MIATNGDVSSTAKRRISIRAALLQSMDPGSQVTDVGM